MQTLVKKWGNLPINGKLTLLTSLLLALAVFIAAIINIRQARVNFVEEWESQSELLLDVVPLMVRDELYRFEIDELADVAKVVGRHPHVTAVVIYDSKGIALVDSNVDGLIFSQTPDSQGQMLVELENGEIFRDWQDEQLLTGKAIYLGNQRIGAVLLGLSTEPLQETITSLSLQSFLVALIVMFLGGIAASLLSRQLTAPLIQLSGLADRLAKGDRSLRADTLYTDEIGKLGTSFNSMAQSIENRENELKNLNESLEQKVQERTVELEKANEDLTVARNDALEASRLKTQLLANVSHDLRTPLNVILGYAEMLQSDLYGNLDDKLRNMAGEIIMSSGQLLNFVNNLIDQAQLETGKIILNYHPFEVSDLLDHSFSVTGILARSKGIELGSEIDADVPKIVVGDMHWLSQVLYNLVSNSVKFTDKGEVRVRVYVPEEDSEKWAIKVSDTGIGIPPNALPHIFDAFWQVDGSPTRGHTGTGLGLSIVKQLTNEMQGEIFVESELGKGSEFVIVLPIFPKVDELENG